MFIFDVKSLHDYHEITFVAVVAIFKNRTRYRKKKAYYYYYRID